MNMPPLLGLPFFGTLGPQEVIIVAVIALLLWGKKLPEVARSLGKGIVEFKRGVQGIEDDATRSTYEADTSAKRPVPDDDEHQSTASRFEPPDSPPT